MWEEEIWYGIEPKEEPSNWEDEYLCDCDLCNEEIHCGDDAIGILAADGTMVMIHDGEDFKITELLDLLGLYYYRGTADRASLMIDAERRERKKRKGA